MTDHVDGFHLVKDVPNSVANVVPVDVGVAEHGRDGGSLRCADLFLSFFPAAIFISACRLYGLQFRLLTSSGTGEQRSGMIYGQYRSHLSRP